MQENKEVSRENLPPIVEFPKVILMCKARSKTQSPNGTKCSDSNGSIPEEMVIPGGGPNNNRDISFGNNLMFNINNRPRTLSASIDRVLNRVNIERVYS